MSEAEKKLDPSNPIVKWIIATLVPLALIGAKKLWEIIAAKIKKVFGYDIPYPEDAVNKLIDWILSLILEQEKLYPDTKSNEIKFNNVIAMVARQADPIQLEIIKRKWGDIPMAVNSIFLRKAKPIIEAKKAQ